MRIGAARCISLLFAVLTVALAAVPPAAANNTVGAWSPVKPWPLIAVHAVLMPDGRVLTYGTKASGQQTAIEIYDVWDPAGGLDAGHTTLPNTSGTDLFCSSQLVLPAGGTGLHRRRRQLDRHRHDEHGQQQQQPDSTTAARRSPRQANMNRARWYSSSTTLLNGETYIQGGSGGSDRPEVREASGAFRLLTGANTGSLDFMYPRNFIAPDGRVFGYDSAGRMYYVNPAGAGSIATAGQFSGPTGSDSSAAMFRPGRILQFGGNTSGALVIDINGATPAVSTTQSLSARRRLVNATILRGRQGARDRRQRRLERHGRRPVHRRHLEPRHRAVDARRQRAARAPLPLECRPHARRERARARRRSAGPAEQHERRGLLSGLPVQRGGRLRDAPRHSRRTDDDRRRRDLRAGARWHRCDQPRRHGQDDLRLAQLQHGAALRRAHVPAERRPARRPGADASDGFAARFLPAVRAERRRHAFGCEDRAGSGRAGDQSGSRAGDRRIPAPSPARLASRFRSSSPRRTRTATRSRMARAGCRPAYSSMP